MHRTRLSLDIINHHTILSVLSSAKESSTLGSGYLNWDWNITHCNGMVQGDGEYLKIQQSGNYFIYAQLHREKTLTEPFTLRLCKNQEIVLNVVKGQANGTINFARPFSLQKGDELYCKKNDSADIERTNETYWGLFKM